MQREHAEAAGLRAERRVETMRLLVRMNQLVPGSCERDRIRDEIIADHMPYARHIALKYGGGGQAEDVIQVAYLALVKAVDNFDPGFGTGFLGYATPVIIGELKRYFRDTTWDVHVPRRMQELSGALRHATDELSRELGRSPTVAQLAERLNADVEEVTEALDAAEAYTAKSLDRPVGAEPGSATLAELVGAEDPGIGLVVDRESLKPLLARLDERDKRILVMRFFRGMSQSEIGELLGVSQMQISRLLSRILGELRAGMG
jgi:RNA polymerase sigma-B factor